MSGLAGPNRAREAQEHLATCPGCTGWAGELRAAVGRAAAVVPLPAVYPSRRLEGLLQTATGVRDGVFQLIGDAKQHALMLATRADPAAAGYAGAARPSGVATVVAGCLALGSGATYCAVEGVPDPVRVLVAPKTAPKPPEPKREPPIAVAPKEPIVATPVVPTTPTPAPTPEPVPAPAPTPEPAPPPPAPVEREFGLEGSAVGAAGPADVVEAQPSDAPVVSAPPPSGPPPSDEFGP